MLVTSLLFLASTCDTCASALDGVCDEPSACSVGSDCTDCIHEHTVLAHTGGMSNMTFIIVVSAVSAFSALLCIVGVVLCVRRQSSAPEQPPRCEAKERTFLGNRIVVENAV